MNLTANVIGATGLVGSQLVKQLLINESFEKVRIFVRRPSAFQHPKLDEKVVDFANQATWGKDLIGDILFSALGTTVKQVGSKEKEYEVDYTFNLNFATTARQNGLPVYVLVSSVGANPRSSVFYSRMKGQLDEAVMKLGFTRTVIIRPSILDGNRSKKRLAESIAIKAGHFMTRFIFKKYRPIKDSIVARAMVNAAVKSDEIPSKAIFTADEIFRLANL